MTDSVFQVATWNPGAVIHIVIPQIFLNRTSMVDAAALPGANVSLWAIEDLPKSADHIMFEHGSTQDRGFRGGFWRVTTERLFILDDAAWQEFLAALDRPVTPKPRLERLFSEPSPFDTEA
jgi:hypothetical protein